MLEDLRDHDANPTPEESEGMSADILAMVFRAAVLAAVALSVGLSVSIVLDQPGTSRSAAVAPPG